MFIAPKPPDILPGSTEGQWEIDWDHPINQGCVFRVLFDEVNAPYDLVTGVKGVPVNGPTRSVAGQMPAAALASASSQYYTFAHHPSWNLLGDKTLIWQGLVASGSAYRHFFGKSGATNDSTTTPWSFWCDSTATPTVAFISANSNYKLFYGGPNVSLNAWHTVAVRASGLIETTPSFYVDGALTNPGSVSGPGTGAPTGNTNDVWVGRRPDGGVQLDGRVSQVVAFSRQLSLDEMHAFYANPYIGLRRTSPWIAVSTAVSVSVDGAAGSAATTGQAGGVSAGVGVGGGAGSAAVSGQPGGVAAGAILDGGTGSAATTGQAGGVGAGAGLDGGAGSTPISGGSGTVATGSGLDGGAGSAAVTGQPGGVASGADVGGGAGSGAVTGGSGGVGAGASLDGGAGSAAITGGPGGVSVDGSSLVRVTPITGTRRRVVVGEGIAPIVGWTRKPIIVETP